MPTRRAPVLLLLLALVLAPVLAPVLAKAQPIVPSQVTQRQIGPDQTRKPERTDKAPVPAARPSAVAGGNLAFTSGDMLLEGAFADLGPANREFIRRTARQRLTVDELFQAARELEQAYARAGYVLVRIVVPQQRLGDGAAVRVVVIDGVIEAVDTTALDPRQQTVVRSRITGLIGKRHLSQDELERRLLIAGDTVGLTLRSALAPGRSDGAARLVVAGTMARVAVRLGTDNALPASLRRWQVSGSLALNNLLGIGDQVYLAAASQLDPGQIGRTRAPLAMLGGGLVVPVGPDGLTVAAELLQARTVPRPLPGTPASVGHYARAELRLNQPVILTRRQSVTLSSAMDLITQSLGLPDFGTQLSRDRYAALRIGTAYQRWQGQTLVSANLLVSQGLGGRRPTLLVGSSQAGASPRFTRANLDLTVSLPLRRGLGLALIGRGQTGFGEPLYLPEQFALESADAISVAEAGSFNVDTGATLRSELRLSAPEAGSGPEMTPYLFAAGGWGRIEGAEGLPATRLSAGAFGMGLRLTARRLPIGGRAGASVGVEFGHVTSSVPGRRSRDRGTVTLALRF